MIVATVWGGRGKNVTVMFHFFKKILILKKKKKKREKIANSSEVFIDCQALHSALLSVSSFQFANNSI